ncbi:hypothetical protein [Actinoplanes derwentensis]|uniref:Uncharacterized protein n=1 Tax=Actinoplanes derwentensis TaxID=113562 RepID=A0A1H1VDU5_9ACTN|nr:hypothetical protein [Actinoplanes derwentensis]GID83728.1 hypothetical protein Ade03nite_26520 [Actinoplanes derwentensis]SDS82922.1 hypothetical protein SAMN04489716_1727 [Actinoplanes derwentensis]
MTTDPDPDGLGRQAADILQTLGGTPDRARLNEAIGLLRRAVAVSAA